MKNMLKKIVKNNEIEEKTKKTIINDDRIEFFNIISEIINNETVRKMKDYRQHCDTSCYTHCMHVAYYSYIIAKKLGLDYWRMKYRDPKNYGLHGFVHPKIALRNALEQFELNVKEQDIIVKHMWPMTVVLPKYKESYIVTLTDKYSAIREIYTYYLSKLRNRKIYKYAYAFFSLMLAVRIV